MERSIFDPPAGQQWRKEAFGEGVLSAIGIDWLARGDTDCHMSLKGGGWFTVV